MPANVETGSPDLPGEQGSGSASSPEENNQSQPTGRTTAGDGKGIEKTISCVSCRKRKLKCDRVKPSCSTCSRLRHECEYPARRRNMGSKRRNMKELEARLAQVETQLVSEQKAVAGEPPTTTSLEADWTTLGMDMDMNIDDSVLLDAAFDMPSSNFTPQHMETPPVENNYFSQELIELGLDEPLPPQEMIDELHQIYFEKFHLTMPMIHKYRYYASLDRAPQFRPPICLRYAMWATAASLSDKYLCLEDIFYERSRRYIQAAEMKGHGEAFVTLYHAQTWALTAFFEAKKTLFSRSWMSTGRAVRLCQMLGLYRIDMDSFEVKTILPPPRDFIEAEERRRTFWASFYGDRWASAGTGWPMLVNEKEIMTNLPSSEEAFELGIPQPGNSLADAMTPEGAGGLSPFGGVILSATLYGHNFDHLHRRGPDERPEDQNGEFWKRHRRMDNVLSNTFMFMPDHLRLPTGLRNMSIVFIHMNVHASSICLHQAAIMMAAKHKLTPSIRHHSHTRCLNAAEEITSIMRLICHVDVSTINSWVGFCLYVAAGVFLKDQKSDKPSPQNMENVDFIIAAMRAIGQKHTVTKHFSAQLELDVEAARLGSSLRLGLRSAPNFPINGILAEQKRAPLDADNLNPHRSGLLRMDVSDDALFLGRPGKEVGYVTPNVTHERPSEADIDPIDEPSMRGLYPACPVPGLPDVQPSQISSMMDGVYVNNNRDSMSSVADSLTYPTMMWDVSSGTLKSGYRPMDTSQRGSNVDSDSTPTTSNHVSPPDDTTFDGLGDMGSSMGKMQYPHRHAKSDNNSSETMFSWTELHTFTTPSEWTATQNIVKSSEGVDSFLQNSGWDPSFGS